MRKRLSNDPQKSSAGILFSVATVTARLTRPGFPSRDWHAAATFERAFVATAKQA
jgi:hypothetical protein